jgi:hypothetical protein
LEGVHSGVKRRRRNRARSRAIGGAGLLGGAGQKEDQRAQNEKRQGTTSLMTLLVISTELLADDVGVAYHAGRGRIRAVTVCTNSWCHVTMDISI